MHVETCWEPAVYMSCMSLNFFVSFIEFVRSKLSNFSAHVCEGSVLYQTVPAAEPRGSAQSQVPRMHF